MKGVFPMHYVLKKAKKIFFALMLLLIGFHPQEVLADEVREYNVDEATLMFMLDKPHFKLPELPFEEEFRVHMDKNRMLQKEQAEEIVEEPKERFELSAKEKEYLILLTYVEAGNQDEEGQIAVAATILNRLESPEFPNSIEEIAFQRTQFSSTKNGKFHIGEKVQTIEMVPEKTRIAVEKAIEGEDPTVEMLREEADALGISDTEKYVGKGALYFYNPRACKGTALEARARIKEKAAIEDHTFYTYWDN